MDKKLTVILAAGGTGGHIFPAKALAEALQAKGHTPILVTDKRSAAYGKFGDLEVNIIPAAGSGKGIIGKLTNMVKIILGMAKASYYLHMASPDVVVGFGGYPSFPTMMAATRRGYKTVIHEQNAVLGRVNRYLSSMVDAIATSFDQVQGIKEGKAILTGNPVREAIKAISQYPYPAITGSIRLLVTGGSQGAAVFANVVPEAVKALPQELRMRMHIDQQCRKEDVEKVKQYYADAGIKAEIAAFFEDIPERLAKAHLVICRAGASTLAEIAIAGRPAILVPYPHAMDNHQMANARAVEATGGAWVMDEKQLTAEGLRARLLELLTSTGLLDKAAVDIKNAGHPGAAEKLQEVVEQVGCRHCEEDVSPTKQSRAATK